MLCFYLLDTVPNEFYLHVLRSLPSLKFFCSGTGYLLLELYSFYCPIKLPFACLKVNPILRDSELTMYWKNGFIQLYDFDFLQRSWVNNVLKIWLNTILIILQWEMDLVTLPLIILSGFSWSLIKEKVLKKPKEKKWEKVLSSESHTKSRPKATQPWFITPAIFFKASVITLSFRLYAPTNRMRSLRYEKWNKYYY